MLLRINSRLNEQVKVVQEFLGLKADGIFGPITDKAVRKFQKENNLVVDGIVGSQTWAAMAAATTDNSETIDTTESGILIHEHYLPKNEYFPGPVSKEWIFLHHTAGWNNPYKVIDSWGRDNRGEVATEYIIGGQSIRGNDNNYDGEIVQAMPENAYAWHLGIGNSLMHRNSIGIELCNFGYLTKGGYFTRINGKQTWIAKAPDKYYTYVGTEAHTDQIIKLKTKFRDYEYWHKYSEKQLNALKELLIHLGNKHNIDIKKGLANQIKQKGAEAFHTVDRQMCLNQKGIWSHTNVSAVKFDVFPQEELMEVLVGL